MKRQLYAKLISWKTGKNRKPLLLQGARQVGKTYLVKAFAEKAYLNLIYLNFEQIPDLKSLFEGALNPESIIHNISLFLGKKISAENTLLFFDEIQTAPEVLTSLKYFYELTPEYHIIAAGSLLGVSVGKKGSFPVGKVNLMTLYPMTFAEYLMAFGEELIVNRLKERNIIAPLPQIIHDKLLTHFKLYLFLGGMPEVLQSYLNNRDIRLVRTLQNEILQAYKRDFSKYTTKLQAIKTAELWDAIPRQLAKENKKFKYNDVRKNARAANFEQTITWLKQAGLINLAFNISKPSLPLSGYADFLKFKVYMLDVGLLGAMLNIGSQIIIEPSAIFSEYKGAFIENYVAQELVANGNTDLFYWTSKSDAEVDFIIEKNTAIYPLEVKSGLSRNLKSLRSYEGKYKPKLLIRTSPRNFIKSNNFINIPLYAVFTISDAEQLI
ncbi:MAG: ATP-binding protein [Flavobacteriaceae bacterium]|nr:ATP-binding protein [Flavobacteriaceae bacterium]